MSYQTLQSSRAWPIVPSDDADIPNIAEEGPSGTANANVANQLVDTTKNFVALGVRLGMVVQNTSGTPTLSFVGGFATNTNPNDSLLLVDGSGNAVDNFPLGTETYEIYGGDQRGALLYVGGAGDVAVVTSGGDAVTFSALPAGSFVPVRIKQVKSTATTATLMLALW